jgi:hypothetical protein
LLRIEKVVVEKVSEDDVVQGCILDISGRREDGMKRKDSEDIPEDKRSGAAKKQCHIESTLKEPEQQEDALPKEPALTVPVTVHASSGKLRG